MQSLRVFSTQLLLVVTTTGLLSGCATLFQPDACHGFKQKSDSVSKDAVYRYSAVDSKVAVRDFRPLPDGHLAAARMYRLWVDQSDITPCQFLTIKSEFYLQRVARKLLFEEVREFYTKDGYKITENRTDLGASLGGTGFYLGEAPLPIPQAAPAGTYRVVSKLYFRTAPNRRPVLLAQASTEFDVSKL